jgi:hypothetical protein
MFFYFEWPVEINDHKQPDWNLQLKGTTQHGQYYMGINKKHKLKDVI